MKLSWRRRRALKKRLPLLETRQGTHGDFARNAAFSQRMKWLLREFDYLELHPVHREALDMIALKISRILSGHAKFKGHWEDIVGYGKLGEEICD